MAKADRFIVTTPVVELGYCYLRKPDTQFNKEGDYKADILMTPEQAKEFCARVESDARATVKGKKARLKPTKVDGQIKFKTKQHAIIKLKSGDTTEVKPRLYHIVDGKTVEYPEDAPAPFAGSKGEVEVEVVPFEGFGGGLTLRLRAIRFHEIVGGSTGGTGDWAEVDDGYTSGVRKYEKAEGEDSEDDSDSSDVEDNSDDEDDRW